MNVSNIKLEGLKLLEETHELLNEVKCQIENRLNLLEYSENIRPIVLNLSTAMRICLLVGLSDKGQRTTEDIEKIHSTMGNQPLAGSFFTKANIKDILVALIKFLNSATL